MSIEFLRRIFERRGYALLPWSQFAELTASQQRLAAELERQQHARNMLADEVTALKTRLQSQADKFTTMQTAISLRDALGPAGAMGDESEPLDRAALQSRLIDRLNQAEVPVTPEEPVYLHVGFGHSGTTSLQLNFFGRRPDLLYLGTPFGDAGGFFSHIKYLDDSCINERQMLEWCRNLIYANSRRDKRPIVVSDETFSDTSELFYCPRHLPADLIARRLKRYFPTARIIFTIRNQTDYVSSMYFNLKRNYAFLSGVALPQFTEWWAGMHSQERCLYLQNLDYSHLIEVYLQLFGRENLLILTLEELKTHGSRRYLEKLCQFMNLDLREDDITAFSVPRNTRMTVVESRLAELVSAGSAEWTEAVRNLRHNDSMAGLIANAPRLSLKFDDDQLRELKRVVTQGNQWIASEFELPLGELGYFV